MAQIEKVYVEDFSGTGSVQVQNAIEYAKINNIKTVMAADKSYTLTTPIIVREGVKLEFGYGTIFVVYGNFKVIELEKNASLKGAYIAIDDVAFNSEVIRLDGKHKYYNLWNRSKIEDLNIINWSGSHKGVGLSLFSGGSGHEISFVNFENVKIAGMNIGIKLKAQKPTTGMAWVNANRFNNVSLDDCVNMIQMESSLTVPYECSGNQWTNLQIQPSPATQKIMRVTGQYNKFEGMIWDLHSITHQNPVIELTAASNSTDFMIPSIPLNRISDVGTSNRLHR
ncbi:hypothetical protein [Domibacillus aminovorans]|uniref:Pectate lyase superfamily protein domain-containing protein n=1 Tax=Domibacillus aminovorans TaxID=29332 RepID=A0A177L273_9BACI|nr:hypothetical protein [Domibacillus aminovorans]OAH59738.1 hypothetical protein AWH49_03205 [Domibacillus aminovorans]